MVFPSQFPDPPPPTQIHTLYFFLLRKQTSKNNLKRGQFLINGDSKRIRMNVFTPLSGRHSVGIRDCLFLLTFGPFSKIPGATTCNILLIQRFESVRS